MLEHDVALALGDYAAELPEEPVEFFRFSDRPCMQRAIVAQVGAVFARRGAHERGHVRVGDACRRRLPERIRHGCSSSCCLFYSGRICGNSITSRMLGLSVNSMTSRSMPMPAP